MVADTNRLGQPVAQTYITNSRQVDWLGGWIGGYMLCGWCSLSINCTHGGWLVQPVAMLSSYFFFRLRQLTSAEKHPYNWLPLSSGSG